MENGTPEITFYGHLFAFTGYGTASRSYLHAFHNASIGISAVDMDLSQQQFVPDPLVTSCLNRHIDPVLYLCHAMPQEIWPLKEVFSRLIVLTTWETDALPPSFVDLLNQVKEVWVPCRYNFDVFRRQLKTPVFQIPHAVHTACASCFDTNEINKRFQLKEDSFVFLSTGTWQERKNLSAIIEAFLRAFPDEPNAVLIIKTLFDFTNESLARAQIFAAIQRANPPNARKAAERIKIYAEFWPDQLMQALAKRADCYVSLHRGEGWCYPLFDAACMGTPVISTAYSGPMDYLDSRYHRLVRYELTPAMRDKQGAKFAFSPDMSWAAPDVIHAASLMREVYDHRQQAMQQAEEGSIPLLRKYSSHAVGRMAAQRLTELAENICCAA